MADNGRIINNYGTFEGWAAQLDKKNTDLRSKLDEIQKKINSLEGDYESDAAVTIRQKITGMTPRFQSYQDVVSSYTKFLRNAAAQTGNTVKSVDANAQQFV